MAPTPQTADATAAFELKGRMLTLSVLRLLSDDLRLLAEQLDAKTATAPDFFRNLPVLLELDAVQGQSVDLAGLLALLRERGLMPVGLRGADEAQIAAGARLGLGQITGGSEARRAAEPKVEKAPPPPPPGAGMIVRQPVRGGQQIYARGGDLIVLAPVSAGAEVLADGHIHVYGSLRGRALAGVRGDREARIFCHSLEAELISVAGNYQVSENIQESNRGRPVQIYLQGESLCIEPLSA